MFQHNSINKYTLDDSYIMLLNHGLKIYTKRQIAHWILRWQCEKWIVMISCFTLQLNVEKLLVKFWYISKTIRSYLKRSTKILLSTYLYRAGISYASLKPITNNWTLKQIWEVGCLLWCWRWKKLQNIKWWHF